MITCKFDEYIQTPSTVIIVSGIVNIHIFHYPMLAALIRADILSPVRVGEDLIIYLSAIILVTVKMMKPGN